MNFEQTKKRYMELLYKPDKSKKGNVDEEIKYLVDYINSLDNYYTTSSCAGRIVLVGIPSDGRKKDAEWIFSSHEIVKEKVNLREINFENLVVNFKQESFILHVCAKTFDDANEMLTIARDVGFKRAGIIATNKRFIIEIMSTENITAPVYDEKLLIDQEYLDYLINQGNDKMINSRKRVKKFFDACNNKI